MFNTTFDHSSIKKYVAIFGSLFTQIAITRDSSNNQVVETIKIPIEYGPREKYMARTSEDPNLNRPYSISLPRMSFEIKDYSYDGERKLSTTRKFVTPLPSNDPNVTTAFRHVYMPVPFNFDIDLNIYVKNAVDGTKIIEQILPYFTPDFTITAHMLAEMPNYPLDIPIIFNGISTEDTYEGNFSERRVLCHTLSFTLKGYLFGPVSKTALIKFTRVNMYDEDTNMLLDYITIQPGETANGQATTNAALTIPYSNILETDNWDYITQIYSPAGKPGETESPVVVPSPVPVVKQPDS